MLLPGPHRQEGALDKQCVWSALKNKQAQRKGWVLPEGGTAWKTPGKSAAWPSRRAPLGERWERLGREWDMARTCLE